MMLTRYYYDADEIILFERINGGFSIDRYIKMLEPTITEFEIPEEFNGEPVVKIAHKAFEGAKYLKTVILPKSIKETGVCAFRDCSELERVEFNSEPKIGVDAFCGCPKLPAETVVMGLVCSTDITNPIFSYGISYNLSPTCFRQDVFELLLKNDCFRNYDLQELLNRMIFGNRAELFPIAEQYGMLDSAELVDELTGYAAETQRVEITAYLLELKKRKFGFSGFGKGDDFEL